MKSVQTALVGAGHLGAFHAEKLFQIKNSKLVVICDPLLERAEGLAQKYSCQAESDFKNIIQQVDAVVIATPTPLHFEIAKFFLENGKHVFLEKPIAQTVRQGEQLCQLANAKNLVLQVGHVERFNPAFVKLKEYLSFQNQSSVVRVVENPQENRSKSKKIIFIEARRLAFFNPRNIDVDVILDLMIHDIDLVLNIVNSPVTQVSAMGASLITPYTDIASACLKFQSGVVANITASRVSSSGLRQLQVFQKQESLSVDFNSSEVKLFKIDPADKKPQVLSPPKADALLVEDRAFIDCIQKSQIPVVSGEQALSAMRVVEQIHEQIKNQ